jgi:hypothetical protein
MYAGGATRRQNPVAIAKPAERASAAEKSRGQRAIPTADRRPPTTDHPRDSLIPRVADCGTVITLRPPCRLPLPHGPGAPVPRFSGLANPPLETGRIAGPPRGR